MRPRPLQTLLESLLLAAAFLGISATSALAGWSENGVPVTPQATGSQDIPILCHDGVSGAYVGWRQGEDAYLQRITAAGEVPAGWSLSGLRLWSPPPSQYVANLAPDLLGGVYVVWAGYEGSGFAGFRFRLLRVLADGALAPGWPAEGLLLPGTTFSNRMDGLVADGTGGVFVVWASLENRLLLQRYSGNGQIAPGWSFEPRPLIGEVSSQGFADVIATDEGGILVCWSDSRGQGAGPGLGGTRFALKILPSGEPDPAWPPGGIQVNSLETTQENSFLISDGAGGAYVGWDDNRNGVYPPIPLDYDIYGQHVLGNGTIDPRWPPDGLPIVIAESAQYFFEMAEDGQGGAIFVWDDYRAGAQIYAVRIRPDGTVAPGWTLFGSPVAARPAAQTQPQAVADHVGGVYALWDQGLGGGTAVIGQHLDSHGTPAPGWPIDGRVIAGGGGASFSAPIAISDEMGGAIVAYERAMAGSRLLVYIHRVVADGPVPAAIAFLDAQVEPGMARIRWAASDAASIRALVQRRQGDGEWIEVGEATSFGESVLEFEDRGLAPGRYAYRLGSPWGGVERFTPEAWVEVPGDFSLALAGFAPNPARERLSVAFTLPVAGGVNLTLHDVRGRVVLARELTGLGPGRHRVDLGGEPGVGPGVYWIRLEHAGQVRRARGVVVG